MTLKDHKKHIGIAKVSYGNFGRNEWSIVGGQCNDIKALADRIIKALSPIYNCAYVDANHTAEENIGLPGRLGSGVSVEYSNEIHFHQFNIKNPLNPFRLREMFLDADLILVNGNHHEAKSQVVIIDESKKSSLQKRLSQLNNVQFIILEDNANEIFDFVKNAIPYWGQLPICRLGETEKIIGFFESEMKKAKPVLNGLVLAGGKSTRMGFDKRLLRWHGKEQQYFMADCLEEFCEQVFISCQAEQQAGIDIHYKSLADTFIGLGPMGAILSAFREKPDSAWLVTACDLPILDTKTLHYLSIHRDPSVIATAFENPYDGLPEPLISIWEPKSYPFLLAYLSQGFTCPRTALRNSQINLIKAPNPEAIMNVNTPDELEKAKSIINREKQVTSKH